jgi:hypothetical protein
MARMKAQVAVAGNCAAGLLASSRTSRTDLADVVSPRQRLPSVEFEPGALAVYTLKDSQTQASGSLKIV